MEGRKGGGERRGEWMVERNLSDGGERVSRWSESRVCVCVCERGRKQRSGWPKGGVVARHRCVSDVICGCHGDAIDWPTRRQTSRESRRHSDYCPSPRPSDYTPTSTPPPSPRFTPFRGRGRRGKLARLPSLSATYLSLVRSPRPLARHATPIPVPRVRPRANASKHTRHASIRVAASR